MAGWSRGLILVLLLAGVGCAEGAKLVQVTDTGGIVTYSLKKDSESIYSSPYRAEAIKLIEDHCQGAYLIVREGETKGESRMSNVEGEDTVVTRRFWGLQFRCK
jgi:hypothetical protein